MFRKNENQTLAHMLKTDSSGDCPLLKTARSGRLEYVSRRHLEALAPDENGWLKNDKYGTSLLHYAMSMCPIECLPLEELEHIPAQGWLKTDANGNPALQYAFSSGKLPVLFAPNGPFSNKSPTELRIIWKGIPTDGKNEIWEVYRKLFAHAVQAAALRNAGKRRIITL